MRYERWEREVRTLYERDPDMDVAEFEQLLEVALRGERPEHPDLPVFLAPPRPEADSMTRVRT